MMPRFRGGQSELARVTVHGQQVRGAEKSQDDDGSERDRQQPLIKVDSAHKARSGQRPSDIWLTIARVGGRGRSWRLDAEGGRPQ